jgi:GR25 family glycosyltransferase involved in LPS biosynthesis
MITINNFKIADCGYYINLDHREDRNDKMIAQFVEHNINGVIRHSANQSTETGPINCKKSHYEIYQKFLDTDNEILLVLEDDCLFLPKIFEDTEKIFTDIFATDWDIFWLGCKNRRWPLFYKNNCYRVSSISHAQSYLIKRNLCERLLTEYPASTFFHVPIDELLSLLPFGEDVVRDPHNIIRESHTFSYYKLDQPLHDMPTQYNSLCYEYPLTTQYQSYSDLWKHSKDLAGYIILGFPHEENYPYTKNK